MKFKIVLWIMLVVWFIPIGTIAQERDVATWEIYIEYDINATGTDRVQFVNLLTGELVALDILGENYTPLSNSLIYYDPVNRIVMTARPDNTVEPHPFIQLGAARRVDWIVSPDERLIAWTLTYDNDGGITTVTTVSNPVGTNQDIVLSDGVRRDGVRAMPVAFTLENQGIVMDSQPDGIGDLAPYRQYANLFQLSLLDGTISPLIRELSCFCAASIRAGRLVRLVITADFSGYDVAVDNLLTDESQTITSAGLSNYTQGGDILIAPDGTRAVYVLSQVDLTSAQPNVRSVIMQVDLMNMTQGQLSEPTDSYLHLVRWTEDNTAILVTIPDRNGTWKVNLSDGELSQIANASYLGSIDF